MNGFEIMLLNNNVESLCRFDHFYRIYRALSEEHSKLVPFQPWEYSLTNVYRIVVKWNSPKSLLKEQGNACKSVCYIHQAFEFIPRKTKLFRFNTNVYNMSNIPVHFSLAWAHHLQVLKLT